MSHATRFDPVTRECAEVVASGAGDTVFDEDAIAHADAAVAALHADYAEWIFDDIRALRAAYLRAVDDPSSRDETIRFIQRKAREIKEHGSGFDYQLMTLIGGSLSDYCREVDRVGDVELAMIEMFIDAMKSVIDKRLAGDGGEQGVAMTSELERAVRLCNGLRRAANDLCAKPGEGGVEGRHD